MSSPRQVHMLVTGEEEKAALHESPEHWCMVGRLAGAALVFLQSPKLFLQKELHVMLGCVTRRISFVFQLLLSPDHCDQNEEL